MVPTLSHVAVLVRSANDAANFCRAEKWEVGPVEDFPTEGTREIYVGPPSSDGLLLVMEAIGAGPYRTALNKRGPGLHHVAVNVGSIEKYVGSLAGSGWLLHPSSLHTLAHRKTVYLARPGFCALIEVQEQADAEPSHVNARFVSEVFLDGSPEHQHLLDALGVQGLSLARKEGAAVVVAGKRVAIGDFGATLHR